MSDEDTFHEKHKEYSTLMQYPPFSISIKRAREFNADFLKEEDRVFSEVNAGNEDAYSRAFSTLEAKWMDDIEEARLYKKRYQDSPSEAREAAMKMANLTTDDEDVPLFF